MSREKPNQLPAAFTVRLEEETLDALDRLAEKTDRSRNWLAAKAIEDYVALNAWQIGKIEEGVAAADRGGFASDDDVARYERNSQPKNESALDHPGAARP
jgi:predicted transcriptional regulator